MRIGAVVVVLVTLVGVRPGAAQQRPVEPHGPEPIDVGTVSVRADTTYARRAFYPLSGLVGNLWQLPVLNVTVGVSPIAELQLTGGPYNRLSITERRAAPLASLVVPTGDVTHAVQDITIGTKIRLVPETRQGPSVGFQFWVRLPNAKHQSGLGQDTTDFSAALLAGKSVGALRVVVNLGATIMSEPLDAAKQNDVMVYGGSVTRTVGDHFALLTNVEGRASLRRGVAPVGTESRAMAKVGTRYQRGAVGVEGATVFGLTATDPTVGIVVGVTYTFTAFSAP